MQEAQQSIGTERRVNLWIDTDKYIGKRNADEAGLNDEGQKRPNPNLATNNARSTTPMRSDDEPTPNLATNNERSTTPMRSDDDTDQKPAFWAQMTQNNSWQKAQKASATPGTLLNALLNKEVVREPVLRVTKPWNGVEFDKAIGRRKENIESLHIQTKGRRMSPTEACSHCKRKFGPYVSCVVPDNLDGINLDGNCANCHFGFQGDRCDFYTPSYNEGRGETPESSNEGATLSGSEVPSAPNRRDYEQARLDSLKLQRLVTLTAIQQHDAMRQQQEAMRRQQDAMRQQLDILLSTVDEHIANEERWLNREEGWLR
jgi:hypothetical protein